MILLLTDGALHARNVAGETFGVHGLTQVLQQDPTDTEIPRQVVRGVREHVGALLPDDATCVTLLLQ